MTYPPPTALVSVFSGSARGKTLNRLLIASLVVSTLSFATGMARLGITSLWIVPSAWVVTLIHHITICIRLAKYKKQTVVPTCDVPPFLKHAANIWFLFIFSMTWFAGSILAIVFTVYGYWWYSNTTIVDVFDVVSGSLGVIEGGLVLSIMVVCWRALSREGYSGMQCQCTRKPIAADAQSIISHDSCAKV